MTGRSPQEERKRAFQFLKESVDVAITEIRKDDRWFFEAGWNESSNKADKLFIFGAYKPNGIQKGQFQLSLSVDEEGVPYAKLFMAHQSFENDKYERIFRYADELKQVFDEKISLIVNYDAMAKTKLQRVFKPII